MASDISFSEYVEAGPVLFHSKDEKIQASFRAAPMHVTVANTIRRQILAAIRTVGFKTEPPESSDVRIDTNTTPLVNEMLMHRIGMIPICVKDTATFNPEDYEFRLDVENIGRSNYNVTAADFVVVKKTPGAEGEVMYDAKQCFPPDPITGDNALITVLRPQYNMDSPPEKLSIRAKASIASGRLNMRYSPVAQCSYEYTRDSDPSRQNAQFLQWAATSKKVADMSAIDPSRVGELKREFECLEVQRCYLQNAKGEPYDFTFHIESVGVLSVSDIMERGLSACEELVSPYTAIDTVMPPNVTIKPAPTRVQTAFEVAFQNEEHTLGNLLQTYLVERHIEGSEKPKIQYAGYKVPHPLRAEMVMIIAADDEAAVKTAISSVCMYLKDYFNSTRDTWLKTPKVGPGVGPSPALTVAPATATATAAAVAPAAAPTKRAAPKKK